MKQPEIFISYSWADKDVADKIYYDLSFVGFDVIKDNHTLEYTDRISDFMEKIKSADFALIIISDSYLKSFNCMTEIMHLENDNTIWKKILPVVSSHVAIYQQLDRIKYIGYWQDKTSEIEAALSKINPINLSSDNNELEKYKTIAKSIDFFLINLKDIINCSPEDLFEKFYRPIFDKVGIEPDFAKMIELIPISLTKDPKKRLNNLRIYLRKYKVENSYCYSVLASCYRDLNNKNGAVQAYKKALTLDNYNYTAWNNLGEVFRLNFKNYDEAKKCYEKAIAAKPEFDIPRLNLGVLLSSYFKDFKGAKEQYEAILKFDECNPKAHNNLANIYRNSIYLDLDKAENHLIIAVNQNHFDAILNYGNFLKVSRNKIEEGNKYYFKAKMMNKDKDMDEVIDLLLNSNKG